MFGRVRGKWIIQAAVQLCQIRISFNGGKTSWGNFFNCPTLLCFVISQDELYGGRIGLRKNFRNPRVWVSILGFWRCCRWLNGNFSLNSFQHFMKFQEMVEKITSIQLKIPGTQRSRLRMEKFPNRHTSNSARFSQPPSPPLFMLARSVNREFKLNYERVRQTCSSTWVIYWLRIKNKLGFSAVLIILIKSITQPRLIH